MKGNLLIVDDEVMILSKLQMFLEDLAEHIYTAENGPEALAILAKEKVHCVLCDINMPKMTGVEVLKQIRQSNPHLPFIFYTGHGNKELMLEAAKLGAFDFLDKPSLEGLEEVISRGLKQGTSALPASSADGADFISEYTKLLNGIENGDL